MSYKEYLEDCINLYYSSFLRKYNFNLVETSFDGIGALSSYRNDLFVFRILNDRGLISTEMAPTHSANYFFESVQLITLIRTKELENSGANAHDKKLLLRRRYSCEEEGIMLDKYYTPIADRLSTKKIDETVDEIRILFS